MGSAARRQISFALSLVAVFVLTHQIILSLSYLQDTLIPEVYLRRIMTALAGYFFPILGGWIAFGLVGGILFACFSAIMVFFVYGVSQSPVVVWFFLEYAGLCVMLYRVDEQFENQVAGFWVDREKIQNEKNDLDVSYRLKGEGISILFEKYSTYYNLRKLAEELASTMSARELSKMVIERTTEFIPRGDVAILSLSDSEGKNLSVISSRKLHPNAMSASKQGDMFDFWAIRNRKRCIVMDSHQDFRFDVTQTSRLQDIRSLIIAPILYEGRVIGTLRVNAGKPEIFTNDDLRLLDAIAALSSSAISNAMLYEKTEELAIRDSLTGLYVRRYFFERLQNEHRRSLLTNRPLSVLMCDIDYFKECNDRYGHGGGDLMLKRFSEILKETCEPDCVVARYGGEEFAVVLPELSKEEAVAVAEKIRTQVETKPFTIRREQLKMTVSIGVATMPDDTLDLEMLVQKADEALYRAKRTGRNKVCLSEV